MSDERDIVTDHAVLRYLERVYGVDVAGLRARIERATAEGRRMGADAVNSDGVSYRLREGRVTTIWGIHSPLSKRAVRWMRRRT